ncbi:uncharacterized protein [Aegilops tauschii subsp. strangulata]|uniref:uncharacterized protein n=1 Tax=Aegilops tauschii subsp. strangulata TaxID=200361 RepID=UPI00098A7BA5|nr:uncharacterized protein LOC109766522 [Aegilops tauschii subsp. strangulata]
MRWYQARSLLEAVQGPRKQAHVVGKRRFNKTGGLLAEDLLLEVTMEEGVGDVHLVHWPSTGDRKVENRVYRAGLDDRSEGVYEVDASTLSEARNDPARFVAIKGTIRTEFVFKDPLPGNHVGMPGTGNKLPRPVAIWASNSSCIAAIQSGSRRAARTKDGNGDGLEVDAAWT